MTKPTNPTSVVEHLTGIMAKCGAFTAAVNDETAQLVLICDPDEGSTVESMSKIAIGIYDRLRAALTSFAAPPPTRVDARDPDCVAAWPECFDGGYDPRCCRFPKSCSC